MKKLTILIAWAALCLKTLASQSIKLKNKILFKSEYILSIIPSILSFGNIKQGIIYGSLPANREHNKSSFLKNNTLKKNTLNILATLSLAEIKLEWLRRRGRAAIMLLFLSFAFMMQSGAQTVPAIKLGEKLPESFWTQKYSVYHNGKTSIQTLAAYKDKLIVLDFWASWCGSCMKKFTMADSLQKEYGNAIAIILVNAANTRDTEENVAPVMKRYKSELKTIILDTTLTKLFPHAVVPHYIWIEQGQYRAATGTEFFTKENIAASVDRRKYLDKVLAKLKAQL